MFKWLKPRPTRLFYVLLQNGCSHEVYSDKQKVNINDRTVIFYHKGQIMAVFLILASSIDEYEE
jgi:hypothetical protein